MDLDSSYRIARAKEFLPLSREPFDPGALAGEGTLLHFPASVPEIPQPPPLCFDNAWQPHHDASICEAPLKVKALHLPVVRDARLVGDGVVLARNDLLLAESIGRHAERLGWQQAEEGALCLGRDLKLSVHRRQKLETVRHEHTALMLFDPAIRRFGMWMLKCLTKLSVLPLLERDDVRVVVPNHVPDYYLALMSDLGVPADRVLRHDPNGISEFRELIVPPKTYTFKTTRHGNPFEVFCYPTDSSRPRSPMRLPAPPYRRIYISRRSIPRRGLANEADVERVFSDFGFHIVEPTSMTASQTVSMFSECEFIAGGHGSGLYNGMFSRRPLRGLQLVPPGLKFANAFLILSHVCNGKGGSAGYVFGRMRDDRRDVAGEFDYTWEVDIDRLRILLERIL